MVGVGFCAQIVSSAAYASGGFSKAKATAEAVIDQAYAYQYGPVAFKPTLASGSEAFRPTRAGALAYFVGGNPTFPNDKGFALKPWRSCEVINQVIQLNGGYATTMGNVRFVDASGKTTTVAAEVCTRPWVSVAGTRCTRCTPLSNFSIP